MIDQMCLIHPSRITHSADASTTRIHIIGAGSISSTAILMKRYDEPQTAARKPISIG